MVAEEIVDSYSETHHEFFHTMKDLHPTETVDPSAFGQSFTVPSTYKYRLTKAKFYLKKHGSPTGNAHAVLHAHSGTYGESSIPTGSALATSDDFDVSTLSTDVALITFTFSGENQYILQRGTHYCIDYENPTSGTINAENYIEISYDDIEGEEGHSGNIFDYCSLGWSGDEGEDLIFYVYGTIFKTFNWQAFVRGLESKFGTFEVTKRKLSLGSPDATTGWYEPSYSESTIDMIISVKGSSDVQLPSGVYASLDAVGVTDDFYIKEDDQILTELGQYYAVKAVNLHSAGKTFLYNACDLALLKLHEDV